MSSYLPCGVTQEMCDVGVLQDNDQCGSCGHRYDEHGKKYCKVEFCECECFNDEEPYDYRFEYESEED